MLQTKGSQVTAEIVKIGAHRDAAAVVRKLLEMVEAGQVCGLALVAKTARRDYEFILTGNFEHNLVEAAGAAGLLKRTAERMAVDQMTPKKKEGK